MTDITIRSIAAALGLGEPVNPPTPSNDEPDFIPLSEMEEGDDADDQLNSHHSVVKTTYKLRYKERADTRTRKPKDVAQKALRRCNGDWLAIELARLTLDSKQHCLIPAFEAILSANGVRHDHWNRTTRGWQGRLRMTGRLALQRVVAENEGELHIPAGMPLPDGTTVPEAYTIKAPRTWVEKTIR